MKQFNAGLSLAVLAAVAHAESILPGAIGGVSGFDDGNNVVTGMDGVVDEMDHAWWNNDHSVHVNNKRQAPAIGGVSGYDGGNNVIAPYGGSSGSWGEEGGHWGESSSHAVHPMPTPTPTPTSQPSSAVNEPTSTGASPVQPTEQCNQITAHVTHTKWSTVTQTSTVEAPAVNCESTSSYTPIVMHVPSTSSAIPTPSGVSPISSPSVSVMPSPSVMPPVIGAGGQLTANSALATAVSGVLAIFALAM